MNLRENHVDQLAQAFSFFNSTTEKLTEAYNKLEEEVARINDELELKNIELSQKIKEIDNIKSHLENILLSMTSAVIATDLDFRTTVINDAAAFLLKINKTNCEYINIREIIRAEDTDLSDIMELIKNDKLSAETEIMLVNREGDVIPSGISGSTIINSTGEKIGYIILIHDLRQIKKLQEKARRADRLVALGEMAARVAHEIRNPLGGIEGFASLLVRVLDREPENQRLASYIVQGAKSVNHIVTSLLNYAKPIYLKKDCFSIQEALFEVCETINNDQSKQNLKIAFEVNPENDTQIYGDKILFQQILWNLLSNAFDSINNSGRIIVNHKISGQLREQSFESALLYYQDKLQHCDSVYFHKRLPNSIPDASCWHCITIKDSGCGIPQMIRDQIFYPFCTTKENGNGLGLSTVYKIIEEHGWKIGVNSEPGRGTWMSIYLPGYTQIQEGVVV